MSKEILDIFSLRDNRLAISQCRVPRWWRRFDWLYLPALLGIYWIVGYALGALAAYLITGKW